MKITKTQLKEIIKEELGALGGEPEHHDASLERPESTHTIALDGVSALQKIARTLEKLDKSGMSRQASTIRNAVVVVLQSAGDYDTAKAFEEYFSKGF